MAVTGSLAIEPILLFLIVFFWTPPHFWALSLTRVDDYARARIPMLPVVSGLAETRRQILIYSLLLVPISAAP
jgi:protoheme IX farnesyltransferase